MRKSGKLVIVSKHFAPDRSTTATYVTAIAERLSTDTEVLVISGTAHFASVVSLKAAQPRVVEAVTWKPEKDAPVRRAIAIVLFSFKMVFATLKHVTKNDVVLCVTTPFTLTYSVTLATKLRGASATLLIYDLYPEASVMAGLVQPTPLVTRTLRFINGLLFRTLDTIITIGRDVQALLPAYKGVESRKIKFIPNRALLPIGYREIAVGNSLRRQFNDRLVVRLSGNLGFTHSVNTIFEAAQLLKDEQNIQVLFSGRGSGWKQLTEPCAANPLDNITLMDPVPKLDLEEFLSAADVWMTPYRRNVAGVSAPSLIHNLLAVVRPIIVAAETISEAALMLKEEDIGWVVRPVGPLDLADVIRAAASIATDICKRSSCCSHRTTLYYDRPIASYRQVMPNVMHNRLVIQSWPRLFL